MRFPYLDAKVRLYNSDGTAVGQSFDIVSATRAPVVTALVNGGFVTAFVGSDAEEGRVIRVQAYDRNGNPNGGAFTANLDESEGGFRITSLTGLPDGRFVLAYEEIVRDVPSRILARILTPGVAPSSETPTLPLPSGGDGNRYAQPHVEQLSNGHLLTGWYEENEAGSNGIKLKIDGTGREILAVAFNADFTPSYDMIALKDGGFAIAWTKTTDSDDADIVVSVFSNAGERIGDDLHVNTTTAGAQWWPELTELADGRITISWTDGVSYLELAGDNTEIRAQIMDPRTKAISRIGTGFDDQYIGTGFGDTLAGASGSDHLRGEGGDDVLDGGVGADKLEGGLGNDVYYIDMAGDTVTEALGGGRDTVIASLSYALSAGTEVEVLKLSGVSSKTSANLTGSDTANQMFGHVGANTLKGQGGNDTIYGGAGNDKLYGGSGTGKDTFVFDTTPHKTRDVDRIYDFNPKYDSVWLENKVFTKVGKGSVSKPVKFKSDLFVKSTKAQDREDRIVYDQKSGALYYDKDGTGSAAQVKIATLSKNLKLTYSDFFVI